MPLFEVTLTGRLIKVEEDSMSEYSDGVWGELKRPLAGWEVLPDDDDSPFETNDEAEALRVWKSKFS